MGVEESLSHVPALRRYARLLTGDAARADDLVQDTLERACRKWALWQRRTELRPWLFTLMHNLYANQRRDWRHEESHDNFDELPEGHAAMPDHATSTALRLDLFQALQAMPAPMRDVLLLVSIEEYSYAEAATILGIPVGTVMSRLHRAREQLRRLMGERDPAAAPVVPLTLVKR